MTLKYAGIGSRSSPPEVCRLMIDVAFYLSRRGLILRSGGADGADSAFEKGTINALGEKEIYLPWKGFNKNESPLYDVCSEALKMAEEYHPKWSALSYGARKLMGRNCYQVLGKDLRTPSAFIICWTSDGKASGGTGQALRIAKDYDIPVHNLYNWPGGFEGWKDLDYLLKHPVVNNE